MGGIAGPASFIAAWALLGDRIDGYSPVHDPISRLAAIGAETRAPMTAGMCMLGGGIGAYAVALRTALPGPTVVAAATTAVASFGVAALPLGSVGGGVGHAAAAGLAYASLAATPLAAARELRRQGRVGWSRVSVAAGILSGAALLGSSTLGSGNGLLQRTGLTVGHVWIAACAAWLLREA